MAILDASRDQTHGFATGEWSVRVGTLDLSPLWSFEPTGSAKSDRLLLLTAPSSDPEQQGVGRVEGAVLAQRIPALTFNRLSFYGTDNQEIGHTTRLFFSVPSVTGLTGAIGWGPDGSRTRPSLTSGSGGSQLSGNFFETGIAYQLPIGSLRLKAGGAFMTGQSTNLFERNGPPVQLTDSFSSVHSGLQADWRGLRIAFDYSYAGEKETADLGTAPERTTWGWSAALQYTIGPWRLGGQYWYARAPDLFNAPQANGLLDIAGAPPSRSWAMYLKELNVGYSLQPGVQLFESLYAYEQSAAGGPAASRRPKGEAFLAGLNLHW